MDDSPQREMTLEEWMDRLPSCHRANRELATLRRQLTQRDEELAKYKRHAEVAKAVLERRTAHWREQERQAASASNWRRAWESRIRWVTIAAMRDAIRREAAKEKSDA